MDNINPFSYSKFLSQQFNKLEEKENNTINHKNYSELNIRRIPRVKSALLIDAAKELKKVTLSSESFSRYMKNKNNIREYTFKTRQISPYFLKENVSGKNTKRITNKKFPNIYYKKLGISEFIKGKNKDKDNLISKRNYESESVINSIEKLDNNPVNYHNISEINNEEENNTVKEMPYGFKYKDTKIIYDKSKLGGIKSILFHKEEESSNLFGNTAFNNVTEILKDIKGKPKFKKKFEKSFFSVLFEKKEVEKNNTFKFFFEGDFLEKNSFRKITKENKEFILKNEEANNYLNELYQICKNIEKFNAKDVAREMKYNLKKYNHNEDFSFDLNIQSLCLKFINQNNINETIKIKPQKLILPFTYLIFFYLLDFETFKIFLSEILIYNEEKGEMEINQKEIKAVLIKYKKYIQFILGPYLEQKQKKEVDDQEKLKKITYNLNEYNFLKIYDWIIYINSTTDNAGTLNIQNNKNIIYKVKIILPMIKFNLITKKIKIKKHIHKNIIINLLKTGLVKWEEKILCELFLNKKFRYLMNSVMSREKMNFRPYNTKKIIIDKINYNQNLFNKHKYEFFITDAKKEHSRYLYISSYEVLLFYGRTNDKFIYRKYINIKDSLNLNKFSIYWGYMNTIVKCLQIYREERKAHLDFKILENSPDKFFNLKLNEKLSLKDIDKNNSENLKNFYNQGYMFYREEGALIDMYLINFILVEPCLIRLSLEKYKFKIPKDLQNIILKSQKSFQNISNYISEYGESILTNKGILNLNFEDFKRRVYNKNLNKGFQDRLKTFSLGIINKSNTLKGSSLSIEVGKTKTNEIKRGISSGIGSLFGNTILNISKNYNKSNTKKFGGSLIVNAEKSEDKKSLFKKETKKISIWKRLSMKKKSGDKIENVEKKDILHKRSSKRMSCFNNINMDQTKDLRDELVNENLDSYRKFQRRKSSIIKTKFIKKAEYLKSYIDKMNKIEKSSIFNNLKKDVND